MWVGGWVGVIQRKWRGGALRRARAAAGRWLGEVLGSTVAPAGTTVMVGRKKTAAGGTQPCCLTVQPVWWPVQGGGGGLTGSGE